MPKQSEYPAASTLDGTELWAVDQGGATKKVTATQIKSYVGAGSGLTNGDKGDIAVSGGGTSLTVESATPASRVFLITGAAKSTDGFFRETSPGSSNNLGRSCVALASFRSAGSNAVGAIVFIAPTDGAGIQHELTIKGQTDAPDIINVTVRGRNSTPTPGTWVALKKTSSGTFDPTVRFGTTPDGRACVIVGDTSSSWNLVQLTIEVAMFSGGSVGDNYAKGWSVAQVTSLTGYTGVTSSIPTTNVTSAQLGTEDFSATPSASQIVIAPNKTFAGRSAADSDYRVLLATGVFTGAFGAAQLNVFHAQAEARHTAGTLSFLRGMEGYTRLGLQGSTTGNVTSARVYEGHVANESIGSAIGMGTAFFANDTDYGDDIAGAAGTVGSSIGFFAGNMGHATKCTVAAVAFDSANMTGGAPVTASFRSAMAGGSNKWVLLSTASAPSAHVGNFRIGDNAVPADSLEVTGGFCKLIAGASKTTSANYHEINTSSGDYIAHFKNTAGSAPNGIRIRFTGASPNNTTQEYLRGEDSVTTRVVIYSNGNLVNQNNSYGAISDRRLKTRVRNAPSQLADVRALKVRKFRMKADGKAGREMIGLIAQEVEKVSPGLVFEDEEGTKGVHYSVAYMKLLKAFQELADIVEKQGKQIEALRSRRKLA